MELTRWLMKQRNSVIFLIDSESFDRNMLSLTLEKITRCKVFNFFSIEECLLYWKLKPQLVIYDSEGECQLYSRLKDKVNLINISKDIATAENPHALKDTTIAQHIASRISHILE